ncbi:helix-turn-helix transcriptional regulator [Halorhabdus sp. CBA1104]|uniref:ArsR/SmtB family transcription factor n=1 Tax=Halorhabdus sp. CBA1104 TaxID=1380432 RepID=UPI001E3FFC64|nr:metalloregulator ArsR/SmtB family transcription factor [Halorhabdus sp. CBA1104]
MNGDIYERQADLCSVFSNPKRLQILDVLQDGEEQTVSAIQDATGIPQSTVSRHLKLMRDRGVLKKREDGVYNYYVLTDERIADGMNTMRDVLVDQLERDTDLLASER